MPDEQVRDAEPERVSDAFGAPDETDSTDEPVAGQAPGVWESTSTEAFGPLPKVKSKLRGVTLAADSPWVVRTADSTQMPAKTRFLTSWPLLRMYSLRQVQLRYRQSMLGLSWTLLQPVAIMAIYGFIFQVFLEVDGGGLPYLSVAWAGLTIWMFVQAAIQMGTVSLQNDSWLLGRVWFPREIIPLAPVLAGLIDLGAAAAILVVIVMVQGIGLSFHIIALPLVLLVLVVWCAAISVFCATVTIFLRDMATIVGLGLRLLFIATPVMYPDSTVPEHLRWVNAVNPIGAVVSNTRATVLSHTWPNWELLVFHLFIGTGFLMLSLWYLRSVERRMVDVA